MTFTDLMIGVGFQASAASIAQVQSDANALKSTISKILGTVGIAFTVTGIKNFIQETSAAAADFKATANQFTQTFSDMEDQASASLSNVSERTGITENRMKSSFTRMAAFAMTTGMETDQAIDFTSRAMEALANNAAYFDKSIEYTQETFQKLLKGNFQLDDNLGFNLAESERNKMAQEMFGASSYNNLEDWQKQELILKKLEDANIAIGAYDPDTDKGQALAEAGEYTNQVGELSDALKQLKVSIGGIFLKPLLTVQTKLAEVSHNLAEALGNVDDEGSLVYRLSQRLNTVVEKLLRYVDKGISGIKRVVDLMGGLDNVLSIASKLIGVIAGYMVAGKIMSIAKALTNVNWKLVGILTLISLIVLLVDDFFGFMNGKESVFGDFVEWMGLDQDDVRGQFKSLASDFTDSLSEMKGALKELADEFSDFMDEHKEDLEALSEFFGGFVKVLAQIALDNIILNLENMLDQLTAIAKITKGIFSGNFDDALQAGYEYWDSYLDRMGSDKTAYSHIAKWLNEDYDTNLPENLSGVTDPQRNVLKTGSNSLIKKASEAQEKGYNGGGIGRYDMSNPDDVAEVERLRKRYESLSDATDDTAKAVDNNSDKVTQSIQFMTDESQDIINSFINTKSNDGRDAVINFATAVKDNAYLVTDAFAGLAQEGKNYIGHSKPKFGPMSDDDKWMPDMIQNFVDGINSNKGKLKNAIVGMVDTIKGNEDGLMALGQPGSMGLAAGSSKNINVTQNISYANTFNGDTRANQVRAAGAMGDSARDTTSYLANAIAFGR